MIDSAVNQLMRNKKESDADEFKRHNERVENYKKWKESHSVKEIKPGDMLDVLDTEYIWCKATVELKIRCQSREPLLFLHYEVSLHIFDSL